ncbi:MAG TPA: dTDP-glucose 4,6-dehydratase [Ktedonobacterales bacterium]|jgi:dTDP-glucose 4,6-dehydratase
MAASPHVLVTGGAGFIGSHFTRLLLEQHPDYRVTVLDALTYAGSRANLRAVEGHPGFRFVQGDICDQEIVAEAMQGCDWVVNFAAETHVDRSIVAPGAFLKTDVEGTFVLLEAAKTANISRFIQISTDEVYGEARAPDGRSRPSLETDALMPRSPYAASKAGADRLAYSYWATYGLPVAITRCSNNYGSHQYPEKQLPLFIVNALQDRPLPIYGTGQNTRDWIHVRDHCAALEALLHAPAELVEGQVFNIGGGAERSILQNAEAVLEILGKPQSLLRFVPDRPGHVLRHAVDSTKLRQTLSWEPEVPFEEGLRQTISWYASQHTWLDDILARRNTFLERALALGASATQQDQTRGKEAEKGT